MSAALQEYEESLRLWPYRVHAYEFRTLEEAKAFAEPLTAHVYDRRDGHIVAYAPKEN